jgi:hypothetical protein
VETTPAAAGTASWTSVVPSATTGMPRCMASSSDSPSDVQRIGCRYTRRRAISSCSAPGAGRRSAHAVPWRRSRVHPEEVERARPCEKRASRSVPVTRRAPARLVDAPTAARGSSPL